MCGKPYAEEYLQQDKIEANFCGTDGCVLAFYLIGNSSGQRALVQEAPCLTLGSEAGPELQHPGQSSGWSAFWV